MVRRVLYGIKNDVEKDSQSWIVREGDRMSKPTAYENYPHPEAAQVDLRLTHGGVKTGGLTLSKSALDATSQGKETLTDNYSFAGSSLAKAEWSNHRMLYATKPLKETIHISGTPRVSIRMACNRPAACLSVWLVSLPWTDSERITDDIITRGWADPQNHRSLSEAEPLQPGEFRNVSFDLQPDDQIIRVGEQIGVMIFSSDRDFTLWPEPGTELTIDLDATTITIPIVGGQEKMMTATE